MIKIENLNKRYGDITILDNINFTFEQGKYYLIEGKSGIGKTTLMNCLIHLTDYTGTIESNHTYSVIFQENRLLENYSILDNLMMIKPKNISKKTYQDKIEYYLKQMNLLEQINTPIHLLSGGMKRRISIIKALLFPGDCLIADEPFTGLDKSNIDICLKLIMEQFKDKLVILITHQTVPNHWKNHFEKVCLK